MKLLKKTIEQCHLVIATLYKKSLHEYVMQIEYYQSLSLILFSGKIFVEQAARVIISYIRGHALTTSRELSICISN